ncbi:alpha/beta hydrolase-fold protein [Glaciecola siphonariae]|uniref:Alpha/beta hydrolase-fold protein n=1 Tax=Glaciecola siphonariae TaxID=521012 RepID=A0ABV9LZ94_9ALTE
MTRALIVVLLAMLMSIHAEADDKDIVIGEILSIDSKVLDEEREYWVSTPKGYDKSNLYPVVYLLDGDTHFESTVGVLDHLIVNGRIPGMILVAILNTDRIRDLTPSKAIDENGETPEFFKTSGGGKTFLKFLKTELMPKIKEDYPAAPYNVIVGHSFGGLFALYSLLEEPGLFQSYISIDPALWWHNQWLNQQLANMLNQKPKRETGVYIASANNGQDDGPSTMIGSQRDFFAKLSTWNNDTFYSSIEYFPTEDHRSVPLIALHNGLRYLFSGHNVDIGKILDDPALLNEHYDTWSKKLGYEYRPPEGLVNHIGYAFLQEGKVDQAITSFKQNVEMYPESSNTYSSLAESYVEKGEITLAIENYQKVILIEGESERVEKIIEELKEKL